MEYFDAIILFNLGGHLFSFGLLLGYDRPKIMTHKLNFNYFRVSGDHGFMIFIRGKSITPDSIIETSD